MLRHYHWLSRCFCLFYRETLEKTILGNLSKIPCRRNRNILIETRCSYPMDMAVQDLRSTIDCCGGLLSQRKQGTTGLMFDWWPGGGVGQNHIIHTLFTLKGVLEAFKSEIGQVSSLTSYNNIRPAPPKWGPRETLSCGCVAFLRLTVRLSRPIAHPPRGRITQLPQLKPLGKLKRTIVLV